ncbi:MAG: hypothetical protein IPL53_12750 [Ignavibacteria bacterium]|nr:hypothetical protein [Ignavibacteria bacterium]
MVFISFDLNDEGPVRKNQNAVSGNSCVVNTMLMDVNSSDSIRRNGGFNRDKSQVTEHSNG